MKLAIDNCDLTSCSCQLGQIDMVSCEITVLQLTVTVTVTAKVLYHIQIYSEIAIALDCRIVVSQYITIEQNENKNFSMNKENVRFQCIYCIVAAI